MSRSTTTGFFAQIEPSTLCSNALTGAFQALGHEFEAWLAHRDQRQTEINWQFGTEDEGITLKSLCPTPRMFVRIRIVALAILGAALRRVL